MRVSFSLLSIKALPETVFADIQSIIGFRHSMKKKPLFKIVPSTKLQNLGGKTLVLSEIFETSS